MGGSKPYRPWVSCVTCGKQSWVYCHWGSKECHRCGRDFPACWPAVGEAAKKPATKWNTAPVLASAWTALQAQLVIPDDVVKPLGNLVDKKVAEDTKPANPSAEVHRASQAVAQSIKKRDISAGKLAKGKKDILALLAKIEEAAAAIKDTEKSLDEAEKVLADALLHQTEVLSTIPKKQAEAPHAAAPSAEPSVQEQLAKMAEQNLVFQAKIIELEATIRRGPPTPPSEGRAASAVAAQAVLPPEAAIVASELAAPLSVPKRPNNTMDDSENEDFEMPDPVEEQAEVVEGDESPSKKAKVQGDVVPADILERARICAESSASLPVKAHALVGGQLG
jgi:hypothetical protein